VIDVIKEKEKVLGTREVSNSKNDCNAQAVRKHSTSLPRSEKKHMKLYAFSDIRAG
jgi:hypothetical protein